MAISTIKLILKRDHEGNVKNQLLVDDENPQIEICSSGAVVTFYAFNESIGEILLSNELLTQINAELKNFNRQI